MRPMQLMRPNSPCGPCGPCTHLVLLVHRFVQLQLAPQRVLPVRHPALSVLLLPQLTVCTHDLCKDGAGACELVYGSWVHGPAASSMKGGLLVRVRVRVGLTPARGLRDVPPYISTVCSLSLNMHPCTAYCTALPCTHLLLLAQLPQPGSQSLLLRALPGQRCQQGLCLCLALSLTGSSLQQQRRKIKWV